MQFIFPSYTSVHHTCPYRYVTMHLWHLTVIPLKPSVTARHQYLLCLKRRPPCEKISNLGRRPHGISPTSVHIHEIHYHFGWQRKWSPYICEAKIDLNQTLEEVGFWTHLIILYAFYCFISYNSFIVLYSSKLKKFNQVIWLINNFSLHVINKFDSKFVCMKILQKIIPLGEALYFKRLIFKFCSKDTWKN